MKKLFLALLLAFAPAAAPARQAAPATPAPPPAAEQPAANPALWVVRDEDTTIYLFGTFHLLDGRPWFQGGIREAFDRSSELVLEAVIPENMAALQPLFMQYAMNAAGPPLSTHLTAAQFQTLAGALAPLGLPPQAVELFKPWFASMMLANVAAQRLGVTAEHGAEHLLSAAARERGMPIGELEGIEWQIRLFDTMPQEQQLAQLRQGIDNLDALPGMLAPMLAAWSSGDVDGLVEILNQASASDPALHRIIFTDRNTAWAGWIQERLSRPGTVFLAVGAGHLAGDDSVQALLAARGLASERVTDEGMAIEETTRELEAAADAAAAALEAVAAE